MREPSRALPAITLAVVGAPYANKDRSNRRFEIRLCKPGEPVELRPEPKNRHDERAIAVISHRGTQLGYLAAERCGRIGQLIRNGHELQAVFQAESTFGAWIRVAFDGAKPTLPEVRAAAPADAQQDWYPDEVWPDE